MGSKILPENTKPVVLIGDVIDKLEEIKKEGIKIHTIITSPPYWALTWPAVFHLNQPYISLSENPSLSSPATPSLSVVRKARILSSVRRVLNLFIGTCNRSVMLKSIEKANSYLFIKIMDYLSSIESTLIPILAL